MLQKYIWLGTIFHLFCKKIIFFNCYQTSDILLSLLAWSGLSVTSQYIYRMEKEFPKRVSITATLQR